MKLEYTFTPKFKNKVRELRNQLRERRAEYEALLDSFYQEANKHKIEMYSLARNFLTNSMEINKQRPVKWGLFNLQTRFETYTIKDFDKEKAIESVKPHKVREITKDAFIIDLVWDAPDLERFNIPGVCKVDENMSYAVARASNRYSEWYENHRQIAVSISNIPPTYRLVPEVSQAQIDQLTKILECNADKLIFEEKEIRALIRLGLKL
ncbi:hypothetical protein FDJ19_gp123 [Vibrio phage Ceto]|uniref:Uncharacterized protein n=1 Tax=Vibrio phage Ceto TaxID=2570300 RepID=A0A2H5BGR0_9CAUD|nr:hypothetical protein FDJ19_gp123 [Vibrio phage Ceto]AUG85175.1 hypothetical protein CETO_193 [Vibrio phage Ceto]